MVAASSPGSGRWPTCNIEKYMSEIPCTDAAPMNAEVPSIEMAQDPAVYEEMHTWGLP